MQCLTDNGDGTFSVTNPQPATISGCTNLIVQPNELQNELFNFSLEDYRLISMALVGLLIVGFTFRAIAQALDTYNGESNHE